VALPIVAVAVAVLVKELAVHQSMLVRVVLVLPFFLFQP
jgi:hypothetical protein